MFKFTFDVGGSAPTNPFTAQTEERERGLRPPTITRKLPAPARRPPPAPVVTQDDMARPRKRGWVPTTSSASEATSQPTWTNGWIDTPAKYLAQASQWHGGTDEADEDPDADLPPAKRRKTLTDSIISTAFSAALIGTAVGMTAYRMWRDRGKSSQEPASPHVDAPPPYQREDWIDDPPQTQSSLRAPRPNKKSRPAVRRAHRHRKPPVTISPARSPTRVVSPTHLQSTDYKPDQGELEDQMDWMGGKIRQLIEEGQRALGKEIVIQTDEQDDEDGAIDDGMEGWEEDIHDRNVAGPSATRIPSKTFSMHTPSPDHGFPASFSSTTTLPSTGRSPYIARDNHAAAGSYHSLSNVQSGNGSTKQGVEIIPARSFGP